jgi:hypothetical protein
MQSSKLTVQSYLALICNGLAVLYSLVFAQHPVGSLRFFLPLLA